MPQPNQFPNLLANSTLPTFDPLYPLGNRPTGGGGGGGTLIARADWSLHGATPTALPGYESTTSWFTYGAMYSKVDNFLRGSYPDTTGQFANGGTTLSVLDLNIHEVFIKFQVRFPRPLPYKNFLKFLKIFGADGDGITTFDSANVTFSGDYNTSGAWPRISFGDGTDDLGGEVTGNDTHRNIFFGTVDGNPASEGYNRTWIGRAYPNEIVQRPLGTQYVFDDEDWHTIQVHHDYSSGTTLGGELPAAVARIWVDGVKILDATNFYNRHRLNPRRIKDIGFGGWTQDTGEFDIDYNMIEISTGGFV